MTTFVFTESVTRRSGAQTRNIRVHRDTCKRAKNPAPLANASRVALEIAKPASCCKPNAGKVAEALEQALELAREQESAADEIHFSESNVAKHYWKPFCREASMQVAEALGVVARARVDRVSLRGNAEDVRRVGAVLEALWEEGYGLFNHWRKNDEAYLAVKAADAGTHWSKSTRAVEELAWLRAFVAGAAAQLKGLDSDEGGNAFAMGYAWAEELSATTA